VVQNVKKITISSVHIAEQNSNNKLITRSKKRKFKLPFFYLKDIGIDLISDMVIFFNFNVPCDIGAKTPF
jgi:hypothetical protein